ncbi:MAG: MraY family glycosyltransferase, partial [Gemmatimonadota bacterium]|nr:MraY family glycosyltransferase [Gemmatimonadota bacterium]
MAGFQFVLLAASFAAAFVAVPVVRRFGRAIGLLDEPHSRKLQRVPVPRTGGIGVVAGFSVGVCLLPEGAFSPGVVALLTGGAIIHLTGILDDRFDLAPWAKLTGQALAGLAAIAGGVVLREVAIPGGAVWHLGVLAGPVTLFLFLGFINAINLADGLDGLAAGVVLVGALAVAWVVTVSGNPVIASLALALAGATAGFLPHNFFRGRTFLGDSGSMLIGYLLGGTAIAGSGGASGTAPLFAALAAVALPVLDTATTIVRRHRRGQGVFAADSMHLHHRLIRAGLGPRRAVAVILAITAVIAGQTVASLSGGGVVLRIASLLPAAFLCATWKRRVARPVTDDAGFREVLLYLLGARDGHGPRLRGDL